VSYTQSTSDKFSEYNSTPTITWEVKNDVELYLLAFNENKAYVGKDTKFTIKDELKPGTYKYEIYYKHKNGSKSISKPFYITIKKLNPTKFINTTEQFDTDKPTIKWENNTGAEYYVLELNGKEIYKGKQNDYTFDKQINNGKYKIKLITINPYQKAETSSEIDILKKEIANTKTTPKIPEKNKNISELNKSKKNDNTKTSNSTNKEFNLYDYLLDTDTYPYRLWSYGAVGTGLVCLTLGIVFQVQSRSLMQESQDLYIEYLNLPYGSSYDTFRSKYTASVDKESDAKSKETLSTLFYSISIAGFASGAILFFYYEGMFSDLFPSIFGANTSSPPISFGINPDGSAIVMCQFRY